MTKILVVWDFDGTIMDTPLPEDGKQVWFEKTNKKWEHKGWWSYPETLNMDVFDIQPIPSVKAEYDKFSKQDGVINILLTGRLERLRPEVVKILNVHNLIFDEYLLNTGGSTDYFKMKTMEAMVKKYSVDNIIMFDDRLDHKPLFESWGEKMVNDGHIKSFVLNIVESKRH